MKVWMGWPYVCDIVTVSYTSIYLCNVPLLYLLFRFRFNFDYFTKLCRTELMGDQNEHICNSIELRTCWCCTNAHYYYWLSLREMVQYCIDFSNRKWFSAVWLLLDSVVASRRYFSHGRAIIFVFFCFLPFFGYLQFAERGNRRRQKRNEIKYNKCWTLFFCFYCVWRRSSCRFFFLRQIFSFSFTVSCSLFSIVCVWCVRVYGVRQCLFLIAFETKN